MSDYLIVFNIVNQITVIIVNKYTTKNNFFIYQEMYYIN